MARWAPAKQDTLDHLAAEITHNYSRGRVVVAVDGASVDGTSAFADDLAAALGRGRDDVVRVSADDVRDTAGLGADRGRRPVPGARRPQGRLALPGVGGCRGAIARRAARHQRSQRTRSSTTPTRNIPDGCSRTPADPGPTSTAGQSTGSRADSLRTTSIGARNAPVASTSCTMATRAEFTGARMPTRVAAATTAPLRSSTSVSRPLRMLCSVDPGFGVSPIRFAMASGNLLHRTERQARQQPEPAIGDALQRGEAHSGSPAPRPPSPACRRRGCRRSPGCAITSCALRPVMAGNAFT